MSPYLNKNRLSDVIALIQLLAYDTDSRRSEKGILQELQRKPSSGDTWSELATDHPEIFRVRNDQKNKLNISLIARYVLPPIKIEGSEKDKRPPLDPVVVNKLIETVIFLHDRQLDRHNRFMNRFLPIIIAIIPAVASIFIVWHNDNAAKAETQSQKILSKIQSIDSSISQMQHQKLEPNYGINSGSSQKYSQ